jgi:hypothetical protein
MKVSSLQHILQLEKQLSQVWFSIILISFSMDIDLVEYAIALAQNHSTKYVEENVLIDMKNDFFLEHFIPVLLKLYRIRNIVILKSVLMMLVYLLVMFKSIMKLHV